MVRIAVFGFCLSLVMFCLETNRGRGRVTLTAVVTDHQLKKDAEGSTYELLLPVCFTIKNEGDASLLVIRDALAINRVSFAGSEQDLKAGKFIYDRQVSASFKQPELESPAPSSVEAIHPNQSFSWTMSKRIHVTERDDHGSSSQGISLETLKGLDTLWIRFEVSFYPTNTMMEEGLKLQEKWKTNGELVVDVLRSEPVKLARPAVGW